MLYWLAELSRSFGPLRLFNYVTFRAGGAWLTAFLLVLLLGGATARMLRRFNVRAAERLEGLVRSSSTSARAALRAWGASC